MPSGPNPDKKKHANRKYGIAYKGSGNHPVFSRSHHLWTEPDVDHPNPTQTAIKTFFGHDQGGSSLWLYNPKDETQYPKLWHKAGKIRRVPKIAVLSTYINWFEQWDTCGFFAPSGGLGDLCDPSNPPMRYPRIQQWNDVQGSGGNDCRSIGSVANPMSSQHKQLYDIFREVQQIFDDEAKTSNDPIYIMVPEWVPREMTMKTRTLGMDEPVPNPDRDWAENAKPMYLSGPYDIGVSFPDVNSPKNNTDVTFQGVPCLMAPDIGFGTNVLHLYCGHWCCRTIPGTDAFGYETWPVGPPGQLIAGIYLGGYLGAPINLTNGARLDWYNCGYPYGYSTDLGNYYDGWNKSAADNYKKNFWRYRDFAIRLFNFDVNWQWSWNLGAVWADRHRYTEARFWASWMECCEALGCGPDASCVTGNVWDDDAFPLHYGEYQFYMPSIEAIEDGIARGLSVVVERIQKYYAGLGPGTANFFQDMIKRNELADYNVSFEGGASQIADASSLVTYIKDYFNKQDPNNHY